MLSRRATGRVGILYIAARRYYSVMYYYSRSCVSLAWRYPDATGTASAGASWAWWPAYGQPPRVALLSCFSSGACYNSHQRPALDFALEQ